MSLKALHSEPAEMTYSAWCTDRSQHNSEKSTVSYVTPALSTINVAPQNGEKKKHCIQTACIFTPVDHTSFRKDLGHCQYSWLVYQTGSSPAPSFLTNQKIQRAQRINPRWRKSPWTTWSQQNPEEHNIRVGFHLQRKQNKRRNTLPLVPSQEGHFKCKI